jgi:hypothetical protein
MTTSDALSAAEFENYLAAAATLFDHFAARCAPRAVLAVDDGDGVVGMPVSDGGTGALADFDQLLAPGRRFVAMVVGVRWSPTAHGIATEACAFVAVTPGRPAVVAVRRLDEDMDWWRVSLRSCPWFLLSTASALRRALCEGEPLTFKRASDEALYATPADAPCPPRDRDGRL